jgi:tetratricopeptide (TPR) repeat protein
MMFICFLLAASVLAGQTPQDAQALENRGDWARAEAVWNNLVRAHPDDYRFWTSLGICRAHEKKFEEAITAYKKALVLNPKAVEPQLNLGVAYFKAGKLEQAITPLRTAASQLPGNQQVNLLLGMCLYGTRRYTDAAPHLEIARAKDPANQDLRFVLAQTYLWGAEYDKARLEFQAMIEDNPNSSQTHMLLGEAYDGLGKADQAIEEFQNAVQSSAVPGAHFGLGYLLWKKHDYVDGATEFRKELNLDPTSYQTLAYLGDAELKLGQTDMADRDLLKSVSIAAKLWIAEFDLGKIEQDRKHLATAREHFKRAAGEDATRVEPHYHLAQIYKAQGDEARASAELAVVSHLQQKQTDDLIVKISGSKRP